MSDPITIASGTHLVLQRRERWEFATRRTGAAVVAILAETAAHAVILTEQWRVPIQARVIDLPAGLVGDGDDHAESALPAGQRELREETGYVATAWAALASWPTSPGLTDETVSVLHATNATQETAGGGIDGEDITVHVVPFAQLRPWLAAARSRGLVIDPKVYAALYLRPTP